MHMTDFITADPALTMKYNGYDGDDESSTSSKRSSWTFNSSHLSKSYQQLRILWTSTKIVLPTETSLSSRTHRKKHGRAKSMVLEPKFADYGTINSMGDASQQHSSTHAFLSPHSILSLPPLDDEEAPTTSKGDSMAKGDLYQRQPLLPAPPKREKWGARPESHKQYRTTEEEDDEDDEEAQNGEPNGIIKINMPPPIREEPRFPQERWKTVIAAIIMFFTFIITLASLAIVHEKVPDREAYPPLPDIFLDNVPAFDWALDVSEYIIMICVNSALLSILLHRHRFIVFRRLFLILSVLYFYRAITMYVTVLPMASTTYYCSPKTNKTDVHTVVTRIVQLFSGLGLSINGKHTYCGDYIYSGHTVILVISYLFISEYTPKKLYLIHWLYFLLAAVGVFMLQLAHGHYTIDVLIAYFITTRTFWTYHTVANNPVLKQSSPNNYLGRGWWFYFFLYFEGNVSGPVPRQWPDWPLPWPRRFQSKSRES